MVPVVTRIGAPEIDEGTKMEEVFERGFRNELTHPFRNDLARHGSADVRIKIAFLQRQIKELRRQILVEKILGDQSRVPVGLGCPHRLRQPARGLPLLNVVINLSYKLARHCKLTFAED